MKSVLKGFFAVNARCRGQASIQPLLANLPRLVRVLIEIAFLEGNLN
jgi:hypothetical protein